MPALQCPVDLAPLGDAGAFQIESTTVDWQWDPACELSIGTPLYAQIPDDLESLGVTVDAGEVSTFFARIEMAGEVLADLESEGPTGIGAAPLKLTPTPVASFVLPVSAETLPQPGCLALLPVADGDLSGEQGEVHFVSRRYAGTGQLTLNLVVVDGVMIDQADLDAAVQVMSALYENNNSATIAGTTRIDLVTNDGPFIPVQGSGVTNLRGSMLEGEANRLNLFFISDFTDAPGTLGIAAGVPGPNGITGTTGSGVILAIDSHLDASGQLDTTLLGETMAHEAGHQLGLFHTSEGDGSEHDLVGDTPECAPEMDTDGDGQLSAAECPDGLNFMFWAAAEQSQSEMSGDQSTVLFLSPIAL